MKPDLSKQFDKNGLRLDYSQKLKELRVYTRFIKNLKSDKPSSRLDFLNLKESFYDFISAAFVWCNTPEKDDFWYEISQK